MLMMVVVMMMIIVVVVLMMMMMPNITIMVFTMFRELEMSCTTWLQCC